MNWMRLVDPVEHGRGSPSFASTTQASLATLMKTFWLQVRPKKQDKSWLEDEEDTITLNYTSGTTGRPKGVVQSTSGAYLNGMGRFTIRMNIDTRYLRTMPMFHSNGWCFMGRSPPLPACTFVCAAWF